jgi:hypothetical protein
MQSPSIELQLRSYAACQCLVVRGVAPTERMAVLPSELVVRGGRCQPTAGRFEEQDGDLLFVPRFPLIGGLSYSLLVDAVEAARVEVPVSTSTPATHLVSIHPTAVQVPVNLSRVHMSFSAPMAEGFAARAVRVRCVETGELLDDVLLPMNPELWDESRQRLTLLLGPGLPEGEPIGISVGRSMRDAAGRLLRAGGGRVYKVGAANRAPVDTNAWGVASPAAGSTDALVVSFDRPLDLALLRRCIRVRHDAASVGGEVFIDEGERTWRFEPAAAWRAGTYALCVDTRLEDVAGNSVSRVSDGELDVAEHTPLVDVPFVIA